MQRFNIALLPQDKSLQNQISAIAQKYFAKIHDNYLLGTEALAHVTLCQLHASSAEEAVAAYQGATFLHSIELIVEEFRVRPGTLVNSGKYIAEFKMHKTSELIDMQKQCYEHLKRFGLEPLTPRETYSPHITLARVALQPTDLPENNLMNQLKIAFTPSIGLSTVEGMFVREI